MPFVSLEAGNNEAQGLLPGFDKSDFMPIAELLVLGVVAVLVLLMVVRPLLGRLLEVYDDTGEGPPGLLAVAAVPPDLTAPAAPGRPRLARAHHGTPPIRARGSPSV